jgi:NhaA family Na+:H+ antiporter
MSKANPNDDLPRRPIDALTEPFERFMHVEAASGVLLLLCTLIALVLANSPLQAQYLALWQTPLSIGLGSWSMSHSLQHWINDGLMAVFFFVIGLEVKREIVLGELRDLRRAALPVFAALGGMVVPALCYLALAPADARAGWGIPMATDIAFVVGCLALLARRVPASLRVLLLSLAIADDIGAILVIAVGYSSGINTTALGLGLGGLVVVAVASRTGVRSLLVYIVLGALVWLAFHASGVHATIAGVALGVLTPSKRLLDEGHVQGLLQRASALMKGDSWEELSHSARDVRKVETAAREAVSPVEYLESVMHPWVGFAIMPIFALANAGVVFHSTDLLEPVALAVGAGLVLGKPLGIVLFCWLAVRAGLARLPEGVSWKVLSAGSCLAGIGFTMALFIASLALTAPALQFAQVGVLAASAAAAVIALALLWWLLPRPK